jgi:hypothetical protein
VVGALAVTAAVGAVVVMVRRKATAAPPPQPSAAADTLPAQDRGAAGAGQVAREPTAPAQVGAPPKPSGVVGEVAAGLAKKGLEAVAGGAAATVQLGLKAAELQRQVVTAVAGEGLGNTAAVFGPAATLGALAKEGTAKAAAALGVSAPVAKALSQTAGMAVAAGPLFAPAVVGAKVTAELASAGIRAIAGEKAEAQVRGVFSGLDPTNHKNATHAPIAAVAKGVTAAANLLSGVLPPPPAPRASVGVAVPKVDLAKLVAANGVRDEAPAGRRAGKARDE